MRGLLARTVRTWQRDRPRRASRGARLTVCALVLGATAAAVAFAQSPWFGEGSARDESSLRIEPNAPYDGRFQFIRLRYRPVVSGFRWGRNGPGWYHDYPRADVHFMKILQEITYIVPRVDGSNILSLDDPELFKFPVAYLSEPGGWQANDAEVEGLRAYLGKGGFVIFDDFRGSDLYNLEAQMNRVRPDLRFIELDGTHPIFHSFFEIPNPLDFIPPYGGGRPIFYGLFEGNNPAKRMLAIADYNNDIGEYWEFSDTGYMPIDLSNEAYKFGVNYIVYAMTH